jgi:hypothetical protein
MTEKPILFSGEMVRAILDGRKTMTRRVVKPQPPNATIKYEYGRLVQYQMRGSCWNEVKYWHSPYGQPGDRLWCRESWYYEEHMHDKTAGEPDLPDGRYRARLVYRADRPDYPVNIGVGGHGWRPSIHMPRWASRITLEVAGIRVERVTETSQDDAISEGVMAYDGWQTQEYREALRQAEEAGTKPPLGFSPVKRFRHLWDSINGKRPGCSWAESPWVWVVEFRRVEE